MEDSDEKESFSSVMFACIASFLDANARMNPGAFPDEASDVKPQAWPAPTRRPHSIYSGQAPAVDRAADAVGATARLARAWLVQASALLNAELRHSKGYRVITVHHLNCISGCPLGGRLMDGRSPSMLQRGSLCNHCLLLETEQGLTLVDTGYGLKDVSDPGSRLSGFFLRLMAPDFREEMTAIRQVESLGFRASDVRHILLTHLDFDHAGGLDDFPEARVHMLRIEQEEASRQRTWLDRQRFRPQQWASRDRWVLYGNGVGEPWYGFDCVRQLQGVAPDILLVPLAGHTHGHAGIAVRGPGGWILLAGDAYFHHMEMDPQTPWCTPGLRMYQTLMEKDRVARLANQKRLRSLRNRFSTDIEVFSSHDPTEFERCAGRRMGAQA